MASEAAPSSPAPAAGSVSALTAAPAAAPAPAACAGPDRKMAAPAVDGVDGAPIELLAEATQLAREALVQPVPHASPNTPPTIATAAAAAAAATTTATTTTADTAPATAATDIATDIAGVTTTPTAASSDNSAAAAAAAVTAVISGGGGGGGGGDNGGGGAPTTTTTTTTTPPPTTTPRHVPPLAIPSDNHDAEVSTPPADEMLISPAVAVTPHANTGSKRTASGAIKTASTSLPATPYQPPASLPPGSASPRAGRERIGELSTQLRSRLSYAMIKMQNGLQGQTFDQVEHFIAEKRQNRLSQSPSIAPAAIPTAAPLASSATIASTAASQALKRQTSADSYSGGLGISLIPQSGPPISPRVIQNRIGRHSRTTSDPSAMYLAPPANIADPNFWVKPPPSPRPSNIRGTVQGSPSQSGLDSSFAGRFQSSPARHLAPAAPIRHHAVSRHHHTLPARRGKLPPPSLPKTFSNMSNMSSVSNISNAPTDALSLVDEPVSSSQTVAGTQSSSGAVRPCTPVRTNTLTMEQDAVESLMFLSSPGHSQHRGSRPASRSAISTHQPQFQSQLIQHAWNGHNHHTDHEGDSFMGETATSTIVDDEEVRLVERDEDDELDRELDRQRKNQEYAERSTDQELRKEVNGAASPHGASSSAAQQRGAGDQATRVKRVKTMEEVLSASERADAAAHWQYTASKAAEKTSAAPVAPSPMLSG